MKELKRRIHSGILAKDRFTIEESVAVGYVSILNDRG